MSPLDSSLATSTAPATSSNRSKRACEPCRKRKVRCFETPGNYKICQRCCKNNLACSSTTPPPKKAVRSYTPLESPHASLLDEVRVLQERIRTLEHNSFKEASVQGQALSSSFFSDVSRTPRLIPSKLAFHEPVYLTAEHSNDPSSQSDDIVRGLQVDSHFTGTTIALIGPSAPLYGLAISRRLPRSISSAFTKKDDDQKQQLIRAEFWALRNSSLERLLVQDSHAFWPCQEVAFNLVETYFTHIDTSQSLGLEKDQIFADLSKGPLQLSSIRAGKLYAIFAISAWYADEGSQEVSNRAFIFGMQWYLASKRLVDGKDSREPLDVAQTLLLQATFIVSKSSCGHLSRQLVVSAVGILNDMGLQHHSILKKSRCRELQMTFWTAYCLDKHSAVIIGRAPILCAEWFDVEPPTMREDLTLCVETQVALLMEIILRAMYAIRVPLHTMRSREHILHSVSSLGESLKEVKAPREKKCNLQICVTGLSVLYVQAEILSTEPIHSSIVNIAEEAMKRIIHEAQGLVIGDFTEWSMFSIVRSAVLSFLLSQSPDYQVRQIFVPLRKVLITLVRKLEGRWMNCGKICDLFSLPSNQDEPEPFNLTMTDVNLSPTNLASNLAEAVDDLEPSSRLMNFVGSDASSEGVVDDLLPSNGPETFYQQNPQSYRDWLASFQSTDVATWENSQQCKERNTTSSDLMQPLNLIDMLLEEGIL